MIVLVVDDEEMIRALAEKVLRRAGFEVLTAETGHRAVELLSGNLNKIAVILIDMSMPDMTGFETIRSLRALSPGIPCIISSGHDVGPDDVPEDISDNIGFLQKPYRSQMLASIVRSMTLVPK